MLLKILSVYNQSWEIMKRNLLFLIGIFGGSYLFLSLLGYLSAIAINTVLIGIITSLLSLFFVGLFYLGLTKIIINLSVKKEASFKDLFSQWNQIANICIVYLLAFATFYLTHKFFMFFAANTGLPNLFVFIWLVLIVLLFTLFFSFINFSVVKYQMGPIMSFKHNIILVKNDIFFVMLFFLLGFVINLIGVMFFYIGLIITIPLTFLAQAIFLSKLEEL